MNTEDLCILIMKREKVPSGVCLFHMKSLGLDGTLPSYKHTSTVCPAHAAKSVFSVSIEVTSEVCPL